MEEEKKNMRRIKYEVQKSRMSIEKGKRRS